MNLFKSKEEIIKEIGNILNDEFIIIDTETTGLTVKDEILEIGILSRDGKVLMDQRIKPKCHISFEAELTHGIKIEDLYKCPNFKEIYSEIKGIVEDSFVIGYNCDFDIEMLMNCCIGFELPIINCRDSYDIMKPYAIIWGEWNSYFKNHKWQKLTRACVQQKIEVNNEHSAIGDCKLTLELMKKISKMEFE